MDTRTTRTEKTLDGKPLVAVTRELYGKDRITDAFVRSFIATAIYPRYGHKNAGEIQNAVYNTVISVAEIIVQTVSLEGDWPEGLILPDVTDKRACALFYDKLMELPDRYMEFLMDAVVEANTEPDPNPTGEDDEKPSNNVPSPVSTEPVSSL
jgi:hypothetical protein